MLHVDNWNKYGSIVIRDFIWGLGEWEVEGGWGWGLKNACELLNLGALNISTLYCITRTRWRRVKTLGQHQVGVNLQSHAQYKLWISTWHIFHEFRKIMPGLSYPVSLVNQNPSWVILLMSSSDSNYVANDHEDVDKYGSFAIPSWVMLC